MNGQNGEPPQKETTNGETIINKPSSVCTTVPPHYGLLFSLNEKDGHCVVSMEPDCNYTEIHPNVYAPRAFTNMTLLTGGGSGVTVFSGELRSSSIVMKHGTAKDLMEVFSLATIARELALRDDSSSTAAAAKDMRKRIPEFLILYISPLHLRDRGSELWSKLKYSIRKRQRRRKKQQQQEEEQNGSQHTASEESYFSSDDSMSDEQLMVTQEHHRHIRICQASDSASSVDFNFNSLDVFLKVENEKSWFPENAETAGDTANDSETSSKDDTVLSMDLPHGLDVLNEIVPQLHEEQERHLWKFTIGQKTIGQHPDAMNGALVHTRGLLEGPMLTNVIDQFLCVIADLQVLTREHEYAGIDEIRTEVAQMRTDESATAANVSPFCDKFCGNAITKNFDPTKGRFTKLAQFGQRFRQSRYYHLEEQEYIPARHLGKLLQAGTAMASVFDTDLTGLSAWDRMKDSWLSVLVDATSCESKAANNLIWTCGLTDAGLHNTFCSPDFLWMFDLGAPDHMPIPAFLTKFLMSFMHVFGMEDDENDARQWLCRFEQTPDGRLALTKSTKQSIHKMHSAFDHALNRFIDQVLEGEEKVRKVLLNYVVLQLVSDAAFCLSRWESKGGGEKKYYTCHRGFNLDKWLWRCLWDLYIATDVWNRNEAILLGKE